MAQCAGYILGEACCVNCQTLYCSRFAPGLCSRTKKKEAHRFIAAKRCILSVKPVRCQLQLCSLLSVKFTFLCGDALLLSTLPLFKIIAVICLHNVKIDISV